MGYKVGVVSQKGGVSKSTVARAIATTYAAADWNVKVADLDINQATTFTWLQRRLKRDIAPVVAVETFGTVGQALKVADNYDLMVFDGAPHANRATAEIAQAVDLLVIPTGLSLDDLEPTVTLANTLVEKHGVPVERIAIVLSKVGDSAVELDEARTYLGHTPYHVLPGQIPEKTAFRRAQDGGLSIVETPYRGPRETADKMVQAIIDRLEELTN
ncbi:ParA family protein [Halomonas sp. OfavH-34-E]|uniref:ParA family protein n=1 Tax=Halomonas sp. OfavH-34-E TaxID=2954491 RepID=UPI00209816F3|nr:ParA family protein [Halomonas sp. OfavH-34-E]MCO7217105.1 ParA family protein [Halomonas sp. OfavH-34-E]